MDMKMTTPASAKPPINKWKRNKRRLIRHYLPFSIVAGLIIAAFLAYFPGESLVQKWSMGTAYAGLVLLGFTLLVGAVNILRSRPNPISHDLTRDAGIMATIVSLVHVGVGLFVHLGNPLYYFIFPPDEARLIPLRYDPFGLTNWVGLAGTLILILLFATSNDYSLRKLGKTRWKTLQRSNYILFGFVALHGIVYQLLEKRTVPFIILLLIMIGVVTILQLAGFRLRRLEKARKMPNEDLDI